MRTGEKIYVELLHGGFEAEVLAGYSISIGEWVEEAGVPISCDAEMLVLDSDNNERLIVKGWMVNMFVMDHVAQAS